MDGVQQDVAAVVKSISVAIGECRRRHVLPSEGSQAALDFTAEHTVAGDGWNDDPIRLAFSQAVAFCTVAEGLLTSTASVLAEAGPGWAVPVVARSTLEVASKGFWLVEHGISLQDRAARACTYQLMRWWWHGKDEEDPDWYQLPNRRTAEILQGAEHRKLATQKPGRGSGRRDEPFVGKQIPPHGELVRDLFAPEESPYRLFSGFAHGGLHALLSNMRVVSGPEDDLRVRVAAIGLPADDQVEFAAAAAVGALSFVLPLFEWTGWLDYEWQATSNQLLRSLHGVLSQLDQDAD